MKNNLYHDIKSQQLHLIVDENDVNEERKKRREMICTSRRFSSIYRPCKLVPSLENRLMRE
jgi:hypothetical protein